MANCKDSPTKEKDDPKKRKPGSSKECGEPLLDNETLLIDILGTDQVAKIPGFPEGAKWGQLMQKVGFQCGYTPLTDSELERVAECIERRTGRPYDWSRTMMYPGACACCSCTW